MYRLGFHTTLYLRYASQRLATAVPGVKIYDTTAVPFAAGGLFRSTSGHVTNRSVSENEMREAHGDEEEGKGGDRPLFAARLRQSHHDGMAAVVAPEVTSAVGNGSGEGQSGLR